MREQTFINKGAVTVDVYTQLRNDLGNSHRNKGYKKPPFNPHNSNNKSNECNGYEPNTCYRCVSADNFIAKFTKPDSLNKEVHWDTENSKTHMYRLNKIDKTSGKSTDQTSHRRYTRLWQNCLTIQKVLEVILEIARNLQIRF